MHQLDICWANHELIVARACEAGSETRQGNRHTEQKARQTVKSLNGTERAGRNRALLLGNRPRAGDAMVILEGMSERACDSADRFCGALRQSQQITITNYTFYKVGQFCRRSYSKFLIINRPAPWNLLMRLVDVCWFRRRKAQWSRYAP
jgi:hypothetical protein